MATADDVAAYIIDLVRSTTAMKLQKLVYYSQAWSLVWDEAPLFSERIEAWANGPVVPALYQRHRGKFEVTAWPEGNPSMLTETQKETVRKVVDFYGQHSPQWLSDLTHQERPWRDARSGLAPDDRSNKEITPAAMAEYYGGLT